MSVIFLIAGWVAGIFAAYLFALPKEIWLLLLFLPVGYLFLFWRDRQLQIWHFVLIALVLGAVRYEYALPTPLDQQLAQFNEQGRASLVGVVTAEPDVRDTQTRVQVDVSKIQTDGVWQDTHGLALVAVPRDTPVQYGDEVQVDGTPETPPDGTDFSYRDYLARQDVFTLVSFAQLYVISSGHGNGLLTKLYAFKAAAARAIAELLPEPSASLLSGILIGDANGMPADLRADFNNTNTAHVIAISGFNVAIVMGVVALLFAELAKLLPAERRGWMKHFGTVAMLLLLLLYTLLVGASASVVRAAIMWALVIVAIELNRTSWVVTALAIAAFIMTLLNPYVLWDVGFQLSFLATLGLVVYAPKWEAALAGPLKERTGETGARKVMDFLREGVIVTAAAFLVTAPILVLYFHQVSLIGFVTNFLILPMQPPLMILGGVATLLQMAANALNAIPFAGLLIGAVAQVVAWGALVCLQYTILVVQATAAVPFGSFPVNGIGLPLVILFYGGLFAMTAYGFKATVGLLFSRPWVPIAAVAIVTALVWTTGLAATDAKTHLALIAAGSGDAAWIRTAKDQRILIDGTGEPSTLLNFLGTELPPWDRRIDLVIATHTDDSNLASLNTVLERYTVGQVMAPVTDAGGVSFAKWSEMVAEKQPEVIPTEDGALLHAGELNLEVMAGTDDGGRTTGSAVALRMEANRHAILFAPRMNADDFKTLAAGKRDWKADVMVLPNSVDKDTIAKLKPERVILFAGKSAREQPSDETLGALQRVPVLRTDETGNVELVWDGDAVQVKTVR